MSAHLPSQTGQDWHHGMCFGCGPENPRGLHADFRFDEKTGEVQFEYTTTRFHEGAPGFVHGGVLASLLDEAQGVLCFHIGHVVMTDHLQIKYHKATPIETPVSVNCKITSVRKRRIFTRATLALPGGEVLVTSKARWYVLSEKIIDRMFRTHYSNEDKERLKEILEANRKRARAIRLRLRGNGDPESHP